MRVRIGGFFLVPVAILTMTTFHGGSCSAEHPRLFLDFVKRKMNRKQEKYVNNSARECFCTQCQAGNSQSELERAGHPDQVAWYAKPSRSFRYYGYYVGGSTPFWRKGDPRSPDEGTFGWDYLGDFIKRRTNLAWWHDRNQTRKFGSYEPDGPKLLEHE